MLICLSSLLAMNFRTSQKTRLDTCSLPAIMIAVIRPAPRFAIFQHKRLRHSDRSFLLLLQLKLLLLLQLVIMPQRGNEQCNATEERAEAEQRAYKQQGEHKPC